MARYPIPLDTLSFLCYNLSVVRLNYGKGLKMRKVYCIYNRVTDFVYVGQTRTDEFRLRQHRYNLNKGNHKNPLLVEAWREYGEDAFEFFFLGKYDTPEETDEAETFYIQWYMALGLSYNIRACAQSYPEVTDEVREKIRKALTGRKLSPEHTAKLKGRKSVMKGKQFSDEVRQKMSEAAKKRERTPEEIAQGIEALKGREFTEEYRQKLSDASKGNQNWLGRQHSEETKKKLSEARKGAGNPRFGKTESEETKQKKREAMQRYYQRKKAEEA